MFLRKYWIGLSVLLVAICALGLFLLRDETPQEPIKIYKTVKPLAKSTAETPQGGHFHADGTWHAETHSQPKNNIQTLPMPDADAAEDEFIEWVGAQFEILVAQMEEKYPELAQLAELTPPEMRQRYPTLAARDALRTLSAEVRAAFFSDLRDLFSLLPVDVRETALEETRQELTQNWGASMADTILLEIRAEMDL